jgi:hypothetical protein
MEIRKINTLRFSHQIPSSLPFLDMNFKKNHLKRIEIHATATGFEPRLIINITVDNHDQGRDLPVRANPADSDNSSLPP